MKDIGGGIWINDGSEEVEKRKQRDEAEKNLNPHDHQFITFVNGGQRYEISLQEFIKEFGSPEQYSAEALKKHVIQKFFGLK